MKSIKQPFYGWWIVGAGGIVQWYTSAIFWRGFQAFVPAILGTFGWSHGHVGILEIEPVGNYAIRIRFDDLHDTGIFSWRYLYELGMDKDRIWQEYLDAVEDGGLSRDPPRQD